MRFSGELATSRILTSNIARGLGNRLFYPQLTVFPRPHTDFTLFLLRSNTRHFEPLLSRTKTPHNLQYCVNSMDVLLENSDQEWGDLMSGILENASITIAAHERSSMTQAGRSDPVQPTLSNVPCERTSSIPGQEQYIYERIRTIFGLEAKELQVKAIRVVIYDGSDLILVAGTSFGKSLIFQAAPLIRESDDPFICLVILPLNAIAKEQYDKLLKVGANPIILNGDTNDKNARKRIANDEATHGKSVSTNSYILN